MKDLFADGRRLLCWDGNGRDSSTSLLAPPLRFTKEGRVRSGHRKPAGHLRWAGGFPTFTL